MLDALDWGIVIVYLEGLLGMSAWLARGQQSGRDYYLAGNKTGPLPIALSTVATQCSTNSLLGAPAFVAFAVPGGLMWLQYELAVPFAMALLMVFLYPVFRGLQLVSLYEYLEHRFGVGARVSVSLLFQLLRAFSTGVLVYGLALVLREVMGISQLAAVLLLGVVTVIYDAMGGMRAVIWSDVLQIIVLYGSIVAAIWVAVDLVGGLDAVLALAPQERLRTLDFSGTGLGDGAVYSFWPMLIGGLFLYVAYYGCDQTQAQRELSTRDVRDTTRALFYDGLLRFPLVLTYCFLGVCLAAYAVAHPDFLQELPLNPAGEPSINMAVPMFVLHHFPHGMIGLVVVGLFAAAMSSLDSTINALSALSMEDVFKRLFFPRLSPYAELWISKGFTVFWGALTILFSFYVGRIADTLIESVNMISSLINGPLLAVFTLGLLTRRANQPGALAALVGGFGTNLILALTAPGLSWLWWNVTGFVAGWVVGMGVSLLTAPPPAAKLERTLATTAHREREPGRMRYAWTLVGYGVLVFGVLALIDL